MATFCAKRLGGDRVHGVEANPNMIPLIEMTFERNSVRPHLYNAIFGKGEGSENFYISNDFWESSQISGGEIMTSIEVPTKDLNCELARISPTFLIVDIEGGEYDVFE